MIVSELRMAVAVTGWYFNPEEFTDETHHVLQKAGKIAFRFHLGTCVLHALLWFPMRIVQSFATWCTSWLNPDSTPQRWCSFRRILQRLLSSVSPDALIWTAIHGTSYRSSARVRSSNYYI